MDRSKKLALVARYIYPNSRDNLWFSVLKDNVTPKSRVLEIGSGSGRGNQNQLYPEVACIVGLDLDQRVLDNPHLKMALHISAHDVTEEIIGGKVDCIYSHMVAEHIDDADRFLSTQLTVLEDDGVIIHSTTSKYYWTSLINNYVPERVKDWLIANLGSGRTSEDVFPALYNLNSEDQLANLSRKLNFSFEIIRQDEPPGYLCRSIVLMLIYSLIHKPLQFVFPVLRPTFIAIIRKK